MRVVVAGAGLGGLALAQGLHAAGLDVVVLERDAGVDERPQGYRIHLDPRAGAALDRCLPAPLAAAVWATSSRLDPPLGFTVTTARLWPRRTTVPGGGTGVASSDTGGAVDRLTLRRILLTGLGSVVRYGAEVSGFRPEAGGVRVLLADGEWLRADLLVGADGVGSGVRRQLLPDHPPVDSGTVVTVGASPLAEVDALLPDAARHGFVLALGPGARLGLGLMRFARRPDALGLGLPPREDYVMWVVGRASAEPDGSDGSGEELGRLFHPRLRALVAAGDPASRFTTRVRTTPGTPHLPPGPVTLLGDAWRAQPPQGGSGASLALSGARLLLEALLPVAHDGSSLEEALAGYRAALAEAASP